MTNRILLTAAVLCPLALTAADQPTPTPYPFDTCIVSGEALGSMGEAHVFVHEGREVKFCCKGCTKRFKADTATYVQVIDDGAKAKASGKVPVNPAAAKSK